TRHFFVDELASRGPFTQLRLNVFPDGGVSRLRVWGKATENGRHAAVVGHINTLADPEHDLRSCCGSSKWIAAVAQERPFADWSALVAAADRVWSGLQPQDQMEAFRAHPRIGETRAPARWTADEQSGTRAASNETMNELAKANEEYEKKFGHVFLICATGRTADEMLASARQRMNNDPATELRIAAEEQRKITALRLEKLVL
ncbi:MAG: 2-oxo-4-hydroxy-4-carboxy-5-ureidoimidazoline decarboxylase, partial [Thermoanaerobaculia bacterium]